MRESLGRHLVVPRSCKAPARQGFGELSRAAVFGLERLEWGSSGVLEVHCGGKSPSGQNKAYLAGDTILRTHAEASSQGLRQLEQKLVNI